MTVQLPTLNRTLPLSPIVYSLPHADYLPAWSELTLKCDWSRCRATIAVPCRHDAANDKAWKEESHSLYAMHLCPAHRRHSWQAVREEQFKRGDTAQSTPVSGTGVED
jgi:hypothetical protein